LIRNRVTLRILTKMSKQVKLVAPLVGWTLFVWGSRTRNVVGNEELSSNEQYVRLLIAGVFLTFAVAVAFRLWRRRSSPMSSRDQGLLGLFVVWTVGFWTVRGIGIIIEDQTLGFTVVHTVLMVISIALALNASRVMPSISSRRLVAQ